MEISRKVPLTSKSSSSDRYILYVIDKSLCMHELFCLEPDRLNDIRLFSMKNLKKLLYVKLSNKFPQLDSNPEPLSS